MDTRNTNRLTGPHRWDDEEFRERGLGPWVRRNPSLLLRLFIVMVFSFAASTVTTNFSYSLENRPIALTVEQLNRGELPAGTEIGDYVRVRGTADIGGQDAVVGTAESKIAESRRYNTSYFYFRLGETKDNILIQTTEGLPRNLANPTEQDWTGKLQTVGTVIFQNTTQQVLERADLPADKSIPVVNTGETPQYLREIIPAYSAIVVLWLFSVAWLVWKKNKPFLGV